MRTYLAKRLLAMAPTILGITVITFVIIQLAPGSPAEFKIRMAQSADLDPRYTAEIIEQTRKLYGLDKPLHVQYLIWLKQVATFNFGESFKDHRPVRDKILERVPVSLQLSLISIFLVYLISVPMGIFSAVKQNSTADRATSLVLFIVYSLPHFWTAMMLITFLGGGDFFDLFPIYGLSSDNASELSTGAWIRDRVLHLVLPVFCLTYGELAYISRQMRGAMLETIRQDYIRTARAKGLSETAVVLKHALRNSLIPIVTLLAHLFPAMIGGSVIIETIFSIPGMGQLSFESILARDYPTIMGLTTVTAFLTLFGILFADLTYLLIDPRISFESNPAAFSSRRFLTGLLAAAAVIALLAFEANRGLRLGRVIIEHRALIGATILGLGLAWAAYLIGGEFSYWAKALSRVKRDKWAVAALVGVAGLFLTAVFAPLLANNKPLYLRHQGKSFFPAFTDYVPQSLRKDYHEFALRDIDEVLANLAPPDLALMPPIPHGPEQVHMGRFLKPPSPDFLLGTDDTGRDVLARIVHGSRIALSVGFVAVGIYVFIGLVLGSLAGYYGGWIDIAVSRLIEVMLSIPTFFLIIAVVAFLEPSIYNVMAAIGLIGWTGTARLVRGEFLKLRNLDFVEASRALGASDFAVIVKHVLPNAITPVLVVATFGIADAILVESSLSFLGFGVQPPTPSWGDILKQSNQYHEFAWWLTVFPGLAVFFTVTALNLIGEGFRDAVDPRLKDQR